MSAPDPDVLVSGHPQLVDDLCWVLATNGIQAQRPPTEPHIPTYFPTYVPEIIPDVIVELLKQTYTVILTVLLTTLVERWLSLRRLSVSIRDQSGAVWEFEGSGRQIKAQIESALGWAQCVDCRSFVPRGNFCDVCGRALSY